MMRRIFVLTLLMTTSFVSVAHAEETEARLREALRTATGQLRAAEDERTLLAAKLSVAEKERDALKAQIAAVTKELVSAKQESAEQAQAITALENGLTERTTVIEQIQGALGQCRTAYQGAVTTGQSIEAARQQLTVDLEAQIKRAESCEAKNIELFRVGSEILDAYGNVDFGDVLEKREPFLGLKRVELETLVQDYKDKLLDGKVAQ
jgi:chromosome segregation ATPase